MPYRSNRPNLFYSEAVVGFLSTFKRLVCACITSKLGCFPSSLKNRTPPPFGSITPTLRPVHHHTNELTSKTMKLTPVPPTTLQSKADQCPSLIKRPAPKPQRYLPRSATNTAQVAKQHLYCTVLYGLPVVRGINHGRSHPNHPKKKF